MLLGCSLSDFIKKIFYFEWLLSLYWMRLITINFTTGDMRKLLCLLVAVVTFVHMQAQSATLVSPKNDSVDVPTLTYLSWLHAFGNDSYEVEYDTSLSFTSPDFRVNTVGKNYTDSTQSVLVSSKIQDLRYNTKYYWRVKCIHGGTYSYSGVFTFVTFLQPTLSYPADGAANIPLSDNLMFYNNTGSINYRVQVGTVSIFTSPIYNHLTFSTAGIPHHDPYSWGFSHFSPNNLTLYYWRVKEYNNIDSSAWSKVWSFTTEANGNGIYDIYKNIFRVFPNPASSEIYLNDVTPGEIVSIQNMLGEVLIVKNVTGNQERIEVGFLPDGLYTITSTLDDEVRVQKILVQK